MAKKRTFSCVTNAGNLDRPILPARVANKNTGFAWYDPLFNDAQILAKLLLTVTLKMKMKSFETRLLKFKNFVLFMRISVLVLCCRDLLDSQDVSTVDEDLVGSIHRQFFFCYQTINKNSNVARITACTVKRLYLVFTYIFWVLAHWAILGMAERWSQRQPSRKPKVHLYYVYTILDIPCAA